MSVELLGRLGVSILANKTDYTEMMNWLESNFSKDDYTVSREVSSVSFSHTRIFFNTEEQQTWFVLRWA